MESLGMVAFQGSGFRGQYGVHLDLDAPGGIEEGGYDDHGGGGMDGGREFAMHAAHGFPVIEVGEIDASADDVVEGGAGFHPSDQDLSPGTPALERASTAITKIWRAWPSASRSSAPTGPVPDKWTALLTRTAREKPMMGSKGDPPVMFCLVMQATCGGGQLVMFIPGTCGGAHVSSSSTSTVG
jgi:hypothetical protein